MSNSVVVKASVANLSSKIQELSTLKGTLDTNLSTCNNASLMRIDTVNSTLRDSDYYKFDEELGRKVYSEYWQEGYTRYTDYDFTSQAANYNSAILSLKAEISNISKAITRIGKVLSALETIKSAIDTFEKYDISTTLGDAEFRFLDSEMGNLNQYILGVLNGTVGVGSSILSNSMYDYLFEGITEEELQQILLNNKNSYDDDVDKDGILDFIEELKDIKVKAPVYSSSDEAKAWYFYLKDEEHYDDYTKNMSEEDKAILDGFLNLDIWDEEEENKKDFGLYDFTIGLLPGIGDTAFNIGHDVDLSSHFTDNVFDYIIEDDDFHKDHYEIDRSENDFGLSKDFGVESDDSADDIDGEIDEIVGFGAQLGTIAGAAALGNLNPFMVELDGNMVIDPRHPGRPPVNTDTTTSQQQNTQQNLGASSNSGMDNANVGGGHNGGKGDSGKGNHDGNKGGNQGPSTITQTSGTGTSTGDQGSNSNGNGGSSNPGNGGSIVSSTTTGATAGGVGDGTKDMVKDELDLPQLKDDSVSELAPPPIPEQLVNSDGDNSAGPSVSETIAEGNKTTVGAIAGAAGIGATSSVLNNSGGANLPNVPGAGATPSVPTGGDISTPVTPSQPQTGNMANNSAISTQTSAALDNAVADSSSRPNTTNTVNSSSTSSTTSTSKGSVGSSGSSGRTGATGSRSGVPQNAIDEDNGTSTSKDNNKKNSPETTETKHNETDGNEAENGTVGGTAATAIRDLEEQYKKEVRIATGVTASSVLVAAIIKSLKFINILAFILVLILIAALYSTYRVKRKKRLDKEIKELIEKYKIIEIKKVDEDDSKTETTMEKVEEIEEIDEEVEETEEIEESDELPEFSSIDVRENVPEEITEEETEENTENSEENEDVSKK